VGLPVTTRSYSDVMFELALRSGGTVFMGRNDLAGCGKSKLWLGCQNIII
jgi:hypothetical protein